MSHNPARGWLGLAAACAVVALAGPLSATATASAIPTAIPSVQNVKVTSFDGAKIIVNFFPATGLETGQTAPTVLEGSGWGLPAYPDSMTTGVSTSIAGGQFVGDALGPASLNADGFNVVTWDNRGWYGSGGQVNIDDPQIEGRDVTAIINWLATLPGVKLKGPDDPVVGMTGASYGGGIQLSAAEVDHRIDVIEPNMSWYSLVDALEPSGVAKSGWGNLLCFAAGIARAYLAPEVSDSCASSLNGIVTPGEMSFAQQVSPGPGLGAITTPTLLLGGTVDTLFPLNGDVETYEALRAAGTPVKMMWYCGGHGICNLPIGATDQVVDEELAFLDRYLKGERVNTGPGFQYLDQTGAWRSMPAYPVPASGRVTATGSGWLELSPFDTSGSGGIEATAASNALNIPLSAPSQSVETLSDARLRLFYTGIATKTSTPIFAQLVDESTGTVLDNQATPIPLILDGQPHSVTVPLNMVVWNLTPSSDIELQLTDATDLYFGQQAFGVVHLSARLALPTSPMGQTQ